MHYVPDELITIQFTSMFKAISRSTIIKESASHTMVEELPEFPLGNTVRRMEEMLYQFNLQQNQNFDFKNERIEIGRLIDRILKKFNVEIYQNKIKTTVFIKELSSLVFDETRLKTILSDVIRNAIIFFDRSKERRTLLIGVVIDQFEAKIVIKDNGIVMGSQTNSKEALLLSGSKLSENYVQGKSQAEKMLDATIDVNSENKKETTVTIKIPNQRQ
jgi:light-regulated signal transduction histidine kinase (bacteriophytochrome)